MTVFSSLWKAANKLTTKRNPDHGQYVLKGEGLQEAGEMLCPFIDEHRVLESDKGPRRPLVVLAFDEADTLTDDPPEQEHWNLFSELRQALRQNPTSPNFFRCSFRQQDAPINSPQISILILQPGSENLTTTLHTQALKGTITMDSVVKTVGFPILVAHCMYVYPSYPFRELLSYQLE
jgi:hypothetical protein